MVIYLSWPVWSGLTFYYLQRLTALVVKSFAEAKELVFIDPNVMRNAILWLTQRQNADNGTFNEPGRVIHKSMQVT